MAKIGIGLEEGATLHYVTNSGFFLFKYKYFHYENLIVSIFTFLKIANPHEMTFLFP